MHKYLWAAAALSVALSAGMFLYVKHAIDHPESILVRYGVASLLSGLNINPLSDPKPALEVVTAQPGGQQGHNANAVISEPEFGFEESEIEPIQIETAPTAEPPITMPQTTDELGTLILSEPEQEGPKPMPYADDAETGETSQSPKLSWRLKLEEDELRQFWQNYVPRNEYERIVDFDGHGDCIAKLAQQIAAAIGGMSWTPFDLPESDSSSGDEDTNYHQSHQSCPYSGACPYYPQCVPTQSAVEIGVESTNPIPAPMSEPAKKNANVQLPCVTKKLTFWNFALVPVSDTMEFRWSDAIRFPVLPIGPY